MFRVDLKENRLSHLPQKSFTELKLRERDHLQEWLANQPDALGEELLIIQKEFDEFEGTRERLDLLALDKKGNLVVIENKLDDSGCDVTWQALKYTAYVSGFTKTDIVNIYQQYLGRYAGGGNAADLICEFMEMEVEELEEKDLIPGNDQRMIFVAAKFRPEVTTTVLWLLSRGIRAQCFKATPYAFGDELMLDIQQIIPPPEAADYMIRISNKENEEKATQNAQQKKLSKLYIDFWEETLKQLRVDGITLYQNISPRDAYGFNASSGTKSCCYRIGFSKDGPHVEIRLQRSEASENKQFFDQLYSQKDAIEAEFGAEFDWRRMDDKKSSRIIYAKSFDGFNREVWPEMISWLSAHIQKLEATFSERLSRLNGQIRSQDEAS